MRFVVLVGLALAAVVHAGATATGTASATIVEAEGWVDGGVVQGGQAQTLDGGTLAVE